MNYDRKKEMWNLICDGRTDELKEADIDKAVKDALCELL
jgi:hypothetical protein